MSFKDECWLLHLNPPPDHPLSRASVLVCLSRHKDLDIVKLVAPLWEQGNALSRRAVITKFKQATVMEQDLKACMATLRVKAAATAKRDAANLRPNPSAAGPPPPAAGPPPPVACCVSKWQSSSGGKTACAASAAKPQASAGDDSFAAVGEWACFAAASALCQPRAPAACVLCVQAPWEAARLRLTALRRVWLTQMLGVLQCKICMQVGSAQPAHLRGRSAH